MRVVIQRVSEASVLINQEIIASVKKGLVVLVGIEKEDTNEDSLWLANKISQLRIFSDKDEKMNLSISEIDGEIIIVSQFTLHAKTKKGNRPSFIHAASPEQSIPLYEQFKKDLSLAIGKQVQSGEFGADMKVSLTNDGPVTILIDTKNKE